VCRITCTLPTHGRYWYCSQVSGRVYVSTVFVRLSVCPTHRPLHAAVVGLLLWARQAEDIDWSRQPPGDAAAWSVISVTLTAAVRSRTDLLNINNNLTYNMYCVKKYQVIYNIQLLAMDSTNTLAAHQQVCPFSANNLLGPNLNYGNSLKYSRHARIKITHSSVKQKTASHKLTKAETVTITGKRFSEFTVTCSIFIAV